MAHSLDAWKIAKAYFEAGKPLSFIVEQTGISKSQISKRSKADAWEKGKTKQIKETIAQIETESKDLRKKKVKALKEGKSDAIELREEEETLSEKKETVRKQIASLDDYEIEVLQELVDSEEDLKSLLLSTTALNLVRINQHLKANIKSEKIGVGEGMQRLEPVELTGSDYKQIQDAIDKASITLGINQRHAPKTTINNTNGQQTNIEAPEIDGYTVEVITPEEVAQIKAQNKIEAEED